MSEKIQLSAREISKIIREIDNKYEEQDEICQLRYILNEEISYKYDVDKYGDMEVKDDDDEKTAYRYLKELEDKLGGRLELISSDRGIGSGDYDGYEWLLKIGDRYFMVYGYYSSWEGRDCDDYYDLNEVKPVEKTIIVYEPVK